MKLRSLALAGIFLAGISVGGCENAYRATMSTIEEALIGKHDLPREPCDYGKVVAKEYYAQEQRLFIELELIGHRQGRKTRNFYGEEAKSLNRTTFIGDNISSCPEFSGSRNFENTLRH